MGSAVTEPIGRAVRTAIVMPAGMDAPPALLDEWQLDSSPLAVRRTVREIAARLADLRIDEALCDDAEMVLAEALNNIVEHAYSGQPGRWITVSVTQLGAALCLAFSDEGMAMPDLLPPAGRLSAPGDEIEALPEGGFGWFLIRSVVSELSYRREEGRNVLVLRLGGPVDPLLTA